MTTGIVQEQNMEKRMGGCMTGFFHIFDRHQNFTGKRHLATKRLTPAPTVESAAEAEKASTAALSIESKEQQQSRSVPSPDRRKQSLILESRSPVPDPGTPDTAETPTKSPLPLPIFEFKEGTRSPWRFSKEAPRLSLDSRAILDAKGSLKPREIRTNSGAEMAAEGDEAAAAEEKQRRSPSVVARLMGLDQLPSQKAELRRSASESRVNRHRFLDSSVNFQQQPQPQQQHYTTNNKTIQINQKEDNRGGIRRGLDQRELLVRSARAEPARAPQHRAMLQRKNFYDSADFFPEPKQTGVTIYGEIENRLKMRGIDGPSKDIETLKQILEALQLKGLLHPNKPPQNQTGGRNFVYDHSFDESPIVVMRPVRSPANRIRRTGGESPTAQGLRSRAGGARRNAGEVSPAVSPRRERSSRGRSVSSPTRSENGMSRPSQRRPLTVETKPVERRRVSSSPVQSQNVAVRRTRIDQTVAVNRSPRNQKPTVEIRRKEEEKTEDELSTVSESSMSICSPTDTERSKMEDYKDGRSLLERCGKLLNSIAEMTAAATGTELQPSPVSVLDSSFYKETSSPSPVLKRNIDFKEQSIESEDEMCSSAISSAESKSEEKSDECDLIYISDILRASNCLPDDSDIFLLLEKQQYVKGRDTSKVSRLERKLIFDTINEILGRKRRLPPWRCRDVSLQQIWSEFQKMKERDESEDLFEAICGVLRKDLAGDAITGWGDCHVEMSEAVLDIERLIFKDLIGETIRDLAALAVTCSRLTTLPRRKLVF